MNHTPFDSRKPGHLLRSVVAALIVAGLSAMLTLGVLLRPFRHRKKGNSAERKDPEE